MVCKLQYYLLITLMATATIGASLLILFKDPIHSIFSLLVSIISSIMILLIIGVEFLAYTFLIIYVGALAVLFLFVIMMLNIKESRGALIDYSSWEFFIALLVIPKSILIFKNFIDYLVSSPIRAVDFASSSKLGKVYANDIDMFSDYLYTHYCFIFILSGIILLVAMLGALILTTNKNLTKSDV